MTARKMLKRIHLVGTIWLAVCAGYLLAMTLRRAGLNGWLVLSLSGYSTFLILLLTSLYLFAFLRNAGGAPTSEVEHPLTSTTYYLGFYMSAPLLGGLVGVFGMAGVPEVDEFLLGIAKGTLGTTFLVWILIDPLFGIIETLLPAGRRHRAERTAGAGHRHILKSP